MDRTTFGSTAEAIGKIVDPAQLQQMLKNPQYAGFTGVIISRLREITQMRQAAQAQQPAAPSVAQQAVAGQQGMAAGGIISFRQGGRVRKYASGGDTRLGKYTKQYLTPAEAPAYGEFGEHAGMTHYTPTAFEIDNPFNMIDPYQAQLAAAVKERERALALSRSRGIAPPVQDTPIEEKGAAAQQPPERLEKFTPLSAPDTGIGGAVALGGRKRAGLPGLDESSDAIYNRIYSRIGNNPDADEERAALKKDDARNPHMAMIRAGLGMAQSASTNPHHGILGNFAAGAGEGLTDYTRGREGYKKQLAELAKVSRQERLGASSQAEQEYASNMRARVSEEGQNARARLLSGAQNKQWSYEETQAVARANELMQRDIKLHGKLLKPKLEYLDEGRRMFVSGIRNADLAAETRAATAIQAAETKIYNDAEKMQPGSGAYALQAFRAQQGMGATGAGGGPNYGSME